VEGGDRASVFTSIPLHPLQMQKTQILQLFTILLRLRGPRIGPATQRDPLRGAPGTHGAPNGSQRCPEDSQRESQGQSKWTQSTPKGTKGRTKVPPKAYMNKLLINRPSGRYVIDDFTISMSSLGGGEGSPVKGGAIPKWCVRASSFRIRSAVSFELSREYFFVPRDACATVMHRAHRVPRDLCKTRRDGQAYPRIR